MCMYIFIFDLFFIYDRNDMAATLLDKKNGGNQDIFCQSSSFQKNLDILM
jgi:hypothetical protein